MAIKVWTKSNCTQCEQTKRFLNKVKIKYVELSLEQNPEDVKRFIDMGLKSAPIVETDSDIWSGFNIAKLNKLIEESM